MQCFTVLLVISVGVLLAPDGINAEITRDRFRLSGDSRPLHYNVSMKIDVDKQKFSGSVEITLEVLKLTDVIDLHYKDMALENLTLMKNKEIVEGLRQTYTIETEILRLRYPSLTPGTYQLNIDFYSTLADEVKGLYRSSYFNAAGEKKYIASSFMSPNYARMAFPCYDEPEYKANFTIQITHPEKYLALSNMPVDKDHKSVA